MIEKNCLFCSETIYVRKADHDRGWGNYCDKSCKAKHQTKAQYNPKVKIKPSKVKRREPTVQAMGRQHRLSHHECYACGAPATNAIRTNFYNEDSPNGVEYTCDKHFDDTHIFDIDQW